MITTMTKTSPARAFNRIKAHANKSRKGQLGLSILGALLALVIGALLTIPIVNAFLDSQRKTRVEANLQDMRTIIADTQRTFGTANQYGALTTAVAVQSGVVPARLRVAGTTTAQNSYNGNITFGPGAITVANDVFVLTWSNVPKSDCADLIFGIEPLTRAISVNSVVVKGNDNTMDPVLVATQCDASNTVAVQMISGRKG